MLKRVMGKCSLIAVACSLSLSAFAVADTQTSFNVPAGGLVEALKELARQSDIQLLYQPEQLRDVKTQGVKGSYSPQEAVNILLQGTTLRVHAAGSGAMVIAPASSAPEAAADSSSSKSLPTEREVAIEGLEEIIVTAQKREERLQDVPISISVVGGEELDRSSSRGIADALASVAGVSMLEFRPGQATINIRGLVSGSATSSAGTTAAGYYLDEVPIAFVSAAELPDVNAYDLSRIEVLRGPQGTLYGANAMSGVVRALTNDANLDGFDAKARVRGADTARGGGSYSADTAVNVPLIPGQLAIRAVASRSESTGFIDSGVDGRHEINDNEAQAYRLKLNYKPSERLGIRLGYSRSDIDNGAPSAAFDNFVTPFSSQQQSARKYDISNLVVDYDWSAVSLLSSTGYLDYTWTDKREALQGGGRRFAFTAAQELETLSQELRLVSRLPGVWRWSAGAIYKDTSEDTIQAAPGVFPFQSLTERTSESYALFAEIARAFLDGKFELTGGLRYSDDSVDLTDIRTLTGGPLNPPPRQSFTYDKLTGRGILTYRPTRERMYYTSVSTGFRSGQPQTNTIATVAPSVPPLAPDSLINYELGTKGTLGNGVFTYDLAAYFMQWSDIQQVVVVPPTFNARVNAGDASGAGVEGSISWRLTDQLSFEGNFSWNDLRFDEDVYGDVASVGSVLFPKGERVNDSPEWTGYVRANYRAGMPVSGMDLVVSSSFNYRSEIVARTLVLGNIAEALSDPAYTWNASIGLQRDRWSVSLYGDNLSDDDGAYGSPEATRSNISIRQRPRTVGVQFTFDY